MYKQQIEEILKKVESKQIKVEEALNSLKNLPYEDLGFAKLDHHRALRKGFPEVIFCQGKTKEQVLEIIKKFDENKSDILATRATKEQFDLVKNNFDNAEYSEAAKTITIKNSKRENSTKKIVILSAGTADIPVAEEAAVTAEIIGNSVERIYDVGVAGIHRLLNNKDKINQANVIIVVAGMEGALPSVVSGITDKPIIAVPTSVGYGASFQGIAPLLTMLNTCSPGVAVMNIDNGFGAGYFASLINK